MIKRILNVTLLFTFFTSSVLPNVSYAQVINLPVPGTLEALSSAFTPAHIRGMVIDNKDPFKFDFIINRGDIVLSDAQKKQEYTRLAKYFLASLTVPDTDQWVNLSPYEHNRSIADNFGKTEMGRDLLAQDYLLKQITSSLSNPDSDLGQKFWSQVYEQSFQKFGNTNIPADVLNKVWITPDAVKLYEKDNTVYVLSQHLKVQMEQDYLATSNNAMPTQGSPLPTFSATQEITQNIMRDVIIPALDREVNTGKNFAQLRQIYSGMLLAAWYKQALKESILTRVYGDQSKVKGVNQDPKNNEVIYAQYLEAFKKGAYNMIREDEGKYSSEPVPRKYFSGGMKNAAQTISDAIANEVSAVSSDDAQAISSSDLARINLQTVDTAQMVGSGNNSSEMLDRYKKALTTEQVVGISDKKQYRTFIGQDTDFTDVVETTVLLVDDAVMIEVSYKGTVLKNKLFYGVSFDSRFDDFRDLILGQKGAPDPAQAGEQTRLELSRNLGERIADIARQIKEKESELSAVQSKSGKSLVNDDLAADLEKEILVLRQKYTVYGIAAGRVKQGDRSIAYRDVSVTGISLLNFKQWMAQLGLQVVNKRKMDVYALATVSSSPHTDAAQSGLLKMILWKTRAEPVKDRKVEIIDALNAWKSKNDWLPADFSWNEHTIDELVKKINAEKYMTAPLDYVRMSPGGRLIIVRRQNRIGLYLVKDNGDIGENMSVGIAINDLDILRKGNAAIFFQKSAKQGRYNVSLIQVYQEKLVVSRYEVLPNQNQTKIDVPNVEQDDGSVVVDITAEEGRRFPTGLSREIFKFSEERYVPVGSVYVAVKPVDSAQTVTEVLRNAAPEGMKPVILEKITADAERLLDHVQGVVYFDRNFLAVLQGDNVMTFEINDLGRLFHQVTVPKSWFDKTVFSSEAAIAMLKQAAPEKLKNSKKLDRIQNNLLKIFENGVYGNIQEIVFLGSGDSLVVLHGDSVSIFKFNEIGQLAEQKTTRGRLDQIGFLLPEDNLNKGTDDAMRAVNGGIDLARSNLDMQIKRDGNGVPLPLAEQNLDMLRVDGLVPVVMNIRPASVLLIAIQP